MLQKDDVVVLQKGTYAGLEPGMELTVMVAKLKSEFIQCVRAGKHFRIARADVIVRRNAPNDLKFKIVNQSMKDFREKRHPTESLMSQGVSTDYIYRR